MLLCDTSIRNLCLVKGTDEPLAYPMLHPYSPGVQSGGVISYGQSHAGYDLRLGGYLLVFKNSYNELIDPKRFKDENYRQRVFDKVHPSDGTRLVPHGAFVIPPHSYALGNSYEFIRIPSHLKGRCVGKSTLARCGILINTTPLEPGWYGHLTIEISNITPCPALVYTMEGIAQLEFELLDYVPNFDYEAKGGKYLGQGNEPVPARIKE